MGVQLSHIIIWTKDKWASAEFLAHVLGLRAGPQWGHFVPVRTSLPRIDRLRATPARVRFLSIEPLLENLGDLNLTGINWVIVGGESGPRARPMKKEWVLSIFRQCRKQRAPFFFKQWGGVRKHETGRVLNGRTYDEFPKQATEIGLCRRN
jgi:protein gp37